MEGLLVLTEYYKVMRKLFTFLFVIMSLGLYSQESNNCLDCAISGGFYCGDDPANWTVYSPDGCVIPEWINDDYVDCVDASDEGDDVVPTTIEECAVEVPCDTVYVDVIEYVDVFITDTVFVDNFIIDTVFVDNFITEYVYITDTVTVYSDADTIFVPVIEYVEVVETDTLFIDVIEYVTEYVEIFVTDTLVITDTIIEIEYEEIIFTEYIDCDTGMPCNSGIEEIIEKSVEDNRLYNLNGQVIRRPTGVYIENGKVKYRVE